MMGLKANRIKFYEPTTHNFLNTNKSKDRLTLWSEIERSVKRGVLGAKAKAGFRTGALRNSIFSYHLGSATGQTYGIRAIRPYALLHHEGSRAHEMTIVRVSGRSRVLTSRTIMHPGTKPNPYLTSQIDTIIQVGRGV